MAKFRMVHTEFWDDPKVVEEMSPEDKYFFLYLLTNSNTTQIGIYQITKKQMAFDTGYSIDTINSLLDRFIRHHKIIAYNPDTREVAIKNWGKYNLNRGGKPVIDCVTAELKGVKDKSLIPIVGERIEKLNIKVLYDTYHDSTTTRGQEKEEEEEKEEEKEEQQEEEKEEKNPSTSSTDAIVFYQNNLGTIQPYISEEIIMWINDLGDDMVIEALRRSLDRNKPSWGYAKSILQSWHRKNIKTLEQAKAEEVEFQNQQSSKRGFYQSKSQEIVPDWFKERKQNKNNTPKQKVDPNEWEETKRLLKEHSRKAGGNG
ncbi:DnaD and phage-associated domain-containing protein [Virgibacillus subterraneus]|uniref:DnaD and phage-associated domain-containing protein n=1 Tax=Virgibacillus subterraneus TaxID=621109 RepID=A0A1H9EAT6_9BACI|nr:DnaD domain protein [Virgibacillus subterraneus]SEQ22749.1 DnaD and phage-associated domain-containing protein [Virgibacillus subterraneus]